MDQPGTPPYESQGKKSLALPYTPFLKSFYSRKKTS